MINTQSQEIEFKTKNEILQINANLSTTATTTTPCQKRQPTKLPNNEKRSKFNSLIIVILFVIMNIINYMDRLSLAGKYFIESDLFNTIKATLFYIFHQLKIYQNITKFNLNIDSIVNHIKDARKQHQAVLIKPN